MRGYIETAGETLQLECALPWVAQLVAEGAATDLRAGNAVEPSLVVTVDAARRPFDTHRWELLSRGAWRRDGDVVVENACTAGFDLHLRCDPDCPEFTFRWRPPARDRAAARVLRSRFHLLARAVLIQYPALWRAGNRGRVPLHASACEAGATTPMLVAPSGVGRSTLVLAELERGGRATGDNLSVGDGRNLWGLVEPLRVEGASGRRMPHGRHEAPLVDRAEALTPDALVVLERGDGERATLRPCSADTAARTLVTSTYMAGELRRYWPFAALLAAGTGVGPSHPAVAHVASTFAARLACFSLTLGRPPGTPVSELLETVRAAA